MSCLENSNRSRDRDGDSDGWDVEESLTVRGKGPVAASALHAYYSQQVYGMAASKRSTDVGLAHGTEWFLLSAERA